MKKSYDVVVIGGGPSGICAALAASRNNASTLIVERYGFLGGMSTSALVYPWFTFHDSKGQQVVDGIAEEIVGNLIELGGSPGHVRDSSGFVWSITPFDKEIYMPLAVDMLLKSNIDILLHSFVSGLQMSNGEIAELHTVGKYGNSLISGKVIIDATGDADIAFLSGSPCVLGRQLDGKVQALTSVFKMGGVDVNKIKEYFLAHPEEFYKPDVPVDQAAVPLTGVSGFFKHWENAPKRIPRDRFLFFVGPRTGEVVVNTTRVIDINPTDPVDITKSEIAGREQVHALIPYMQSELPGFESSYLIQTATQIGVRESRRILGDFVLTERALSGQDQPYDSVARCGYPVDIHVPDGGEMELRELSGSYGIPYRVMLPQHVDNLIVTGRAVSATHEVFSSLRVTAPVMALGQAAGTAAAMAVALNSKPRDIPIGKLQALLLENDAIL